MENLIYSCVFIQKNYIKLITLLFKSLNLYGQISSAQRFKYLIITSTKFEQSISDLFVEYNINGTIWCMDIDTLFEAGYSRLNIFDYPDINKYKTILYLDCDILITNNINKIFDLVLKEDKLYVLKEGSTGNDQWWPTRWEGPIVPAFTSGILLFKNSNLIKNLFKKMLFHIQNHINAYKPVPETLDQPFIVYHAVMGNMHNNKMLEKLAVNNPDKFNNEIISHFPGNPGHYKSKFDKMSLYLNKLCNKTNNIPKIIMQTSKNKVDEHIINTIDKWCPNWKYYHFIDKEIICFFKENQLKEFPNIIEKFNSFQKGQHKADIFRYYFLYLKGGIFLDSDAMFEMNINHIIKNYYAIFSKSFMTPSHLFNGFIATQPKNPIIYEALKHAYNTDNAILNKRGNGPYGLQHYHYFCEELWRIYNRLELPNCKIYQEVNKSHEGYGGSIVVDDNNNKILSHYWESKSIPLNKYILLDSIKQYIPKNRNILELKKYGNTIVYPDNISKESEIFVFKYQKNSKLNSKTFIDIGFIYYDIPEINSILFSDIKEIIRKNRPTVFLRNYRLYKMFNFNIAKYCVINLGNYIYINSLNPDDLILIPVHNLIKKR